MWSDGLWFQLPSLPTPSKHEARPGVVEKALDFSWSRKSMSLDGRKQGWKRKERKD